MSFTATITVGLSDYKPPHWKRVTDLIVGGVLAFLSIPVVLCCGLAVRCTSAGPALHWSRRVGKNNAIFLMPKFRTMLINTPQVATHLLPASDHYVTAFGRWLRKSSLDELPQLVSVLIGDLSLVGPRPALFNQDDLVALRTRRGLHRLVPGITGLAQINGRDELEIPVKVDYDAEYMRSQSFVLDSKIMFLTLWRVLRATGVRH